MTFTHDNTIEELKEKIANSANQTTISINDSNKLLRIKRAPFFKYYAKIEKEEPLTIKTLDVTFYFQCFIYLFLLIFCVILEKLDNFTAILLFIAGVTLFVLMNNFSKVELYRIIVCDLKFKIKLNNYKYIVPYNHFYYLLITIISASYPLYQLVSSITARESTFNLIVTLIIIIFAIILITYASKNINEVFIIDLNGIIRQNIFFKNDKIFYNSNDIEKIKVVNKDLSGRSKPTSFVFAIKIKKESLYKQEKSNFLKIKEREVIFLPYTPLTAVIFKMNLNIDVDDEISEIFQG